MMVLYGIGCHRTTPTPHSRKHQRPRPTDEAPLFRFSNYCIRKDMQAGVLTHGRTAILTSGGGGLYYLLR